MFPIYTLDELKAMKNAELKKIAEHYGLPTSGSNVKLAEAIFDVQSVVQASRSEGQPKPPEGTQDATGTDAPTSLPEGQENNPPQAGDDNQGELKKSEETPSNPEGVAATPASGASPTSPPAETSSTPAMDAPSAPVTTEVPPTTETAATPSLDSKQEETPVPVSDSVFRESVSYVRVTPVRGVDLSMGNVNIPAQGIVVRADNASYSGLGPQVRITPAGHPDDILSPSVPEDFSVPVAVAGERFSHFLDIGNTDASWFLVEGHLPVGISLAMNGYLTGVPQAPGVDRFVLEVRNQKGTRRVQLEFVVEA